MASGQEINILIVDDQPAKLLSYEIILEELGVRLIKANSATEALEALLKHDIAVILVDVCMPDFDGFQLAAMIREHPRFARIAIIFISAIHLTDADQLRGYEMGAVDYVPVPVVPQVLRAKVRVFAELYQKTRQLERLNDELERHVAERTAELEKSNRELMKSEQRRRLALIAGRMGSWDWDLDSEACVWDEGQCTIFGVDSDSFVPTVANIQALVHPEDWAHVRELAIRASPLDSTFQIELRVIRPDNETRWCLVAAACTFGDQERLARVSGVSIDISDIKATEERQLLLAREVDHRARNALAVVQAIIRLTEAGSVTDYAKAVEGRVQALAKTHQLLSKSRWRGADLAHLLREELAPYAGDGARRVEIAGPSISLAPEQAQSLALIVHELATNAAKYGSLSRPEGGVRVTWSGETSRLHLSWNETGGPPTATPVKRGFGTKIINTTMKRQIGGQVEMDWSPEGLKCRLDFPLQRGKDDAGEPPEQVPRLVPKGRKRVLLVEDEPMVGMMMQDILQDLGYFVLGPFATVAEARQSVDAQGVDVAVLDVNLGATSVYPLAAHLAEARVPSIFVTGYDSQSIDARYRHAPVLQKPVSADVLETALSNCLKAAGADAALGPLSAALGDGLAMQQRG